MPKRITILVLVILATAACRKEKAQPISDYESAQVQSKAYNFLVYPGARLLQPQTDLLKKAAFIIAPNLKEAPAMVMYDTDAPLEQVAPFYAGKYGYQAVAANETADFSAIKPKAYYTSGDLGADAVRVKMILDKMKMNPDVSAATGKYRGAFIAPQTNLPRVSLQRPYYDVVNRKVVDRTLILMVRE